MLVMNASSDGRSTPDPSTALRTCSRTLADAPFVDRLTRQVRVGGEVELVEHARLPRGHRGGAGGGEIGDGEQVEIAQPLAPVHLARELGDRGRVLEIAARGHVVHEKVLQDEVAALLDVLGGRPRRARMPRAMSAPRFE